MRLQQCEQCGKEFKNIANLKAHVKSMHSTGPDVKYKCHICSKQLKQDNSYRKHMANAHGIGERCEHCNKLYKTKKVLELHIKRVHGLNTDDMSSGSWDKQWTSLYCPKDGGFLGGRQFIMLHFNVKRCIQWWITLSWHPLKLALILFVICLF